MEDLLQSPRVQMQMNRIKSAEDKAEKIALATALFDQIQNMSDSITSRMEEGMVVNNLDEVQAALHNEFNRNVKVLTQILKQLKLSGEEQTGILQAIEKRHAKDMSNEFQTITIKKARDKVYVENLSDIYIPEDVRINNLEDLGKFFKTLEDAFKAFKVDIPAPQVTVQPTPINIPETRINFPEQIDLDPIIKALETNLNKIRTNSKERPLAVRLTDGKEFISTLRAILDDQKIQFAGFNENMRIKDAQGNAVNPATAELVGPPTSIGVGNKSVTTAGTAVQLTSTATPCRKVIIVAKSDNTGKIFIGGSTVDSSNGGYIFAGATMEIEINDVSKIYIDSETNGEGVQFTYVS